MRQNFYLNAFSRPVEFEYLLSFHVDFGRRYIDVELVFISAIGMVNFKFAMDYFQVQGIIRVCSPDFDHEHCNKVEDIVPKCFCKEPHWHKFDNHYC